MTLLADLDIELPNELIAREPPEARGLARDGVRLMVSRVRSGRVTHATFARLPEFLASGDLLIVNSSAAVNAAFEAVHAALDGSRTTVLLHLSAPLSEWRYVIELRRITPDGNMPLLDASAGDRLLLPAGGAAVLVEPYMPNADSYASGRVRLWSAALIAPGGISAYASRYGAPIRYGYVPKPWPLEYYQTLFSREPGSAEMPSAARAFTPRIVERLARLGVRIAPIVLHAGVSSLEPHEAPYPERYRVSSATARAINEARARGSRTIAVGTTVVRALETVATSEGQVHPGQGWTDLVITADRGLRIVDGILTGLHSPDTTHLALLEALAGRERVAVAYNAALRHRYLWHEFGDLHLILP